ncbi:DUF6160 family protein [Alkanindiges sp. WGS2144]|uniref:DUF6160 family protein n=1 Tax=Alkanindiges sp. WGS2144 TaxID=3366808 RepID=UPI003750270A
MKNLIIVSSLLCFAASANAALEVLTNSDMQQVDGQAGAYINLDLRLNHTSPGVFDDVGCADLKYCRLALAINNRYHDGTQDTYDLNGVRTPSATGKKLWLVFKGIQGSINVQQMALEGVDLAYGNIIKPSVQLSFDPKKPIQIRNLGFSALSIETDEQVNEGGTPGYLAAGSGGAGATAYVNGKYTDTTNQFDFGRETGFTGLNINGNLSVAGTIKVFSCDSGHPRC